MAFEAIFFDVDDTLFDRNGAQLMVLDVIAREFCGVFVGLDREVLVEAFTESDRITLLELYGDIPTVKNVRICRARVFLGLLGLDGARADAIAALYVEAYPRMNAPVDGAVALVEALSPKYQLGVISNSSPDVQYQKLETLGIGHFFDSSCSRRNLASASPTRRSFGMLPGWWAGNRRSVCTWAIPTPPT